MKKIIRIVLSVLISVILNSVNAHNSDSVRNIILMIGDGMGVAQVYGGYTANKGFLNLEKSTYIGFSKTHSANKYITDSGAGGTAISTGQKTNNFHIAVDTNKQPLKTILESAVENGIATGLVVTASVTHATPASFIAHNISRYDSLDIAYDYLKNNVDIFIGGGKAHFEDRKDSVNLTDSLRQKGYEISYSIGDLDPASDKKLGCFVADYQPPSVIKGRGDYLPLATKKALEKLNRSKNGFFLMVEGSQIDWAGHDNDLEFLLTEVIDFDKAVGEAYAFADENPGTLVIVTADHETGGFSIIDGDLVTGNVEGVFGTDDHTGVMVPVFSYGSGAEEFAGIYENTEIYHKMRHLLGLK
ncbi:MAG: alkaline phosphatase [Bacteroidales bacterium]|nr:alkaline phosphatase [Bacteroidales bacterium]